MSVGADGKPVELQRGKTYIVRVAGVPVRFTLVALSLGGEAHKAQAKATLAANETASADVHTGTP